ncbi:universal stress protein [Pedobacter sp. Du54]|uniref:universal stress protein n=1 Tax=Pedobacter anseongensis TaxID=3133439 RepID=UPI0030B151AE
MKKILVPIDYSSYSDQAVRHAIQIAKKINAEIHLFHGLEIPELLPMAGVMMWPLENFEELKEESDERLEKYIDVLKNDYILTTPYLPTLTSSTETGSVVQIIDKLTSTYHFDLIVMGLAGAGRLNQLFWGSNSRAVIEKIKHPVLLVPKNTDFVPLRKIAFATDLSESDLNSIQSVARLFSLFDPEILLVHVNKDPGDEHNPSSSENIFLNNVKGKLNYGKIYYRHLIASDINEGLTWLAENGLVNLMAIIHRHASPLTRLLTSGHTKMLANSLHIPLLVLPEDKRPIGW